jgi:NADPH2:quinone reductase
VGRSTPCGNEGAGTVVAAGASAAAQALLGKRVGVVGGSMYSDYRLQKLPNVFVLPEGTTCAQGAAWFVNPMTVLGFVGTMKLEGFVALLPLPTRTF